MFGTTESLVLNVKNWQTVFNSGGGVSEQTKVRGYGGLNYKNVRRKSNRLILVRAGENHKWEIQLTHNSTAYLQFFERVQSAYQALGSVRKNTDYEKSGPQVHRMALPREKRKH